MLQWFFNPVYEYYNISDDHYWPTVTAIYRSRVKTELKKPLCTFNVIQFLYLSYTVFSYPGNGCKKLLKDLSPQEIGIAKLSGFSEWFSNNCIASEVPDSDVDVDMQYGLQKTIIFGHHLKVLDGIQVAFN